jgi:thioredoxin reductase (NADPH)
MGEKVMLDTVIIGSGPAGLAAAIYAKRAGLDVLVLEKVYGGTGQVAESSRVDNYPGFAGINGYELGEKFREHAVSLGVGFRQGEAAAYKKEADVWNVVLTNGEKIEAAAVIYAAGATHRHLNVEGEDTFAGAGVSYCATCDGAFFKKKKTAVIGGGDTAMDDALYLAELCEKVYLIHRRKEFRGSAGTLEKIRQKENIELVTEAQIRQITGDKRVSAVILQDGREIEVDGVFVAVGMIPQTEEIKGQIPLDANGYVIADETGKTAVDGFFAAGDVRTKALRQVVTAVSDGANAATSAAEWLMHRQ